KGQTLVESGREFRAQTLGGGLLLLEAVDRGLRRRNLSSQSGQPRFRFAREIVNRMEGGELVASALAIRPQLDQGFQRALPTADVLLLGGQHAGASARFLLLLLQRRIALGLSLRSLQASVRLHNLLAQVFHARSPALAVHGDSLRLQSFD